MKVADHVWYITGGASGLGEATARQIHKLGGYVAIFDINEEAAEGLSKDLGNERSTFARVDVVSEEDVQDAIAKCDKQWPKIKVGGVINCGGVGMAGKTINGDGEPFDLDTFRTVVEINLIGTFNVCRLVAARLVRDVEKPIKKASEESKDLGVLINTASVAAFEGQTGQVSYSAGKGGVVGMTLPMARDLAWFGIRTMTLAPALFSTPMADKMSEKAKKALGRQLEFPVSIQMNNQKEQKKLITFIPFFYSIQARFGLPDEFALAVISVIENPMLVSRVVYIYIII